jgi:hypothetical protein
MAIDGAVLSAVPKAADVGKLVKDLSFDSSYWGQLPLRQLIPHQAILYQLQLDHTLIDCLKPHLSKQGNQLMFA